MFAAAQSENSGAVRKAYASTIAELAKYAPEARINTLAKEIAELYSTGDDRGRFLAGLQAKELARNASEAFNAQATIVSLLLALMQQHARRLHHIRQTQLGPEAL